MSNESNPLETNNGGKYNGSVDQMKYEGYQI